MTRQEIEKYLRMLGEELEKRQITGEIMLAGGAVMLLVVQSRGATLDIDAYFLKEPQAIRQAIREIARQEGLPPDWLNDGVKGFFGTQPPVDLWHEYPGLRVYTVTPQYLFAMKVSAGRPQDIRDLRALLAYLHLGNAQEALAIAQQYIPERLLTPKVRYLIEALFEVEAHSEEGGGNDST